MQKVVDKAFLIKLGNRIRMLRIEQEMSQLDLGVKMDNYAEQIGRIEKGKLNVTICTLKKIAESLNIKITDLLNFEH